MTITLRCTTCSVLPQNCWHVVAGRAPLCIAPYVCTYGRHCLELGHYLTTRVYTYIYLRHRLLDCSASPAGWNCLVENVTDPSLVPCRLLVWPPCACSGSRPCCCKCARIPRSPASTTSSLRALPRSSSSPPPLTSARLLSWSRTSSPHSTSSCNKTSRYGLLAPHHTPQCFMS